MRGSRPLYVLSAIPTGQPHTPTTHAERQDSYWHRVDSLLLNEAGVFLVYQ
jgi:hypothetical protein